MHYIKIIDMNDQVHRYKTRSDERLMLRIRKHKGKIKEIIKKYIEE